jgi:nitronate monooxygenase
VTPAPLSFNPAEFAAQLGCRHPIIQAPMAGGITTSALVVAVSRAGGLGSLACGMLAPLAMRQQIQQIRDAGCLNFAVNLFVVKDAEPDGAVLEAAAKALAPYYQSFGLNPAPPKKYAEPLQAQLELALESSLPIVSFTFDLVDRSVIRELRNRGTRVIGTATTVDEALAWEEAGADAVCAQGLEAGGHRGGFSRALDREQLACMALIPRVRSRISIPVIAAGGIMDGSGIAAGLALGATAVQLGTAFLCADEAGTHPLWKRELQQRTPRETALTVAFSGRPARGLRNRFIDQMASCAASIPPYPVQNALTAPIRAQAALRGDPEYMSLWAGQAHAMIRSASSEEIVRQLVEETALALARLNQSGKWSALT